MTNLRLLLSACLLAVCVPLQAAPRYALTDLRWPGGRVTEVAGINNAGQVAGTWAPDDIGRRGFVYTPGQGYRMPEPVWHHPNSTLGMIPSSINQRGEVAGAYQNLAFVYRPDGTGGYVPRLPRLTSELIAITDLGQAVGRTLSVPAFVYTPFKGAHTVPPTGLGTTIRSFDIDNHGQVLMAVVDVSQVATLYLFHPATMALTPLTTASSASISEAHVNDAGLVAASVGGVITPHAMLYRAGNAFDLSALTGQRYSRSLGVNADGMVLGVSYTGAADTLGKPFLYTAREGLIRPLAHVDPATSHGWTSIRLTALNDAGDLAGSGVRDGERRLIVLKVLPD